MAIDYLPPSSLTPDPNNARRHSPKQISKLKATVSEFGFASPILADEKLKVIVGHARLMAAIELGMKTVPVVRLTHLMEDQKPALALADNKLSDMSDFDPDLLARQLSELCALDFNIELTGFETGEVDLILEQSALGPEDPEDDFSEPDADTPTVSRPGDLWALGEHALICGDALDLSVYEQDDYNLSASGSEQFGRRAFHSVMPAETIDLACRS